MISSFLASVVLLVLTRNGVEIGTAQGLIIVIAVTTVCWIATAYRRARRPIPRCSSISTARCARSAPAGAGARARRSSTPAEIAETGDNFPLALVGWLSGCTMIWSALFTVGNFLYGRMRYALGLWLVFADQRLHRDPGRSKTLEVIL